MSRFLWLVLTGLSFLAASPEVARVRLEVFDLKGQRTYDSGFVSGPTLTWHYEDQRGNAVANGIYLYFLTAERADGTRVRSLLRKIVVRS